MIGGLAPRMGAAFMSVLLATSPLVAQDGAASLAARCTGTGTPAARCTELAVTARSLQGSVGILAGLGSEVSGSSSTLGRRLGTSPRVSAGARAAFAPFALPDIQDPGSEPSRETTFMVPAVHAGVALGLFDGFFLAPTVGGFLSLDVLGHASVLFLPTGEGFDGRANAWSVGARVGLVRESFTLPGVSVSLTRRDLGRIRLGAPGGDASVVVDPTVTSVRATVGKDLLSIGVVAGVGWDRYGGSAIVGPGPMSSSVSVLEESFRHRRSLVFGGASMNFLILQLSAEAGWARGFGEVDGYRGAPHDPTRGTAFGSLAFRLTL